MKAPAFWGKPPGLAAALLEPAAFIYGAVAARRMLSPGERASIPALCVGNVTVGGSGKTPVAIAMAALLRSAGYQPAFLLRGYGGSLRGPLVVDRAVHISAEVGDEALLLARWSGTIVSRDRLAGARLAAELGHDVVVMDDGLQNPSLRKDLALAVFDAATGIGNGRVLPAGPLRAPLDAHWPLIDAAVVLGSGQPGEVIARTVQERGLPVIRGRLQADPAAAAIVTGRRVLAFAGIGHPAKFFATLRQIGAEVVEQHPYPDHHAYSPAEIAHLLARARRQGLLPVTTEKDAVRLSVEAANEVQTVPVTVIFDDPEQVAGLLRTRLTPA